MCFPGKTVRAGLKIMKSSGRGKFWNKDLYNNRVIFNPELYSTLILLQINQDPYKTYRIWFQKLLLDWQRKNLDMQGLKSSSTNYRI